ncbi:MAG: AarF/ABC1/UbiB kinase family protein [Deferrisomatales bacterium]
MVGRSESLRRLAQIAWVLAGYGVKGGLAGARGRSWGPMGTALARAFDRLGPAFVKLGQFLSVRPDLVPPAALEAFERLQDRAEPVAVDRVLRVAEEELGAPARRLFREFDPEPVATASLSQVHRAVLPGGAPVAVKVQRPGAAQSLQRDLRLVGRAARLLVALSPLRGRVDPRALWGEVLETAAAELDFRREAETAETVARNLRGVEGVRIPRVYWGWTGRRVLTTEFVEGAKISDPSARGRGDYPELAERGARVFLSQVLEHGLFHADLHPANLLLTPAGEIAYVDFGITGRLSPEERRALLGALAGLLCRDAPLALRHLALLGVGIPRERVAAFTEEVATVMDRALVPRLGELPMGEIGRGILAAVHRHRVVFPRKHALLIKALVTIEGTARLLHPGFSFEREARNYLSELARKGVTLGGLAELAWRAAALIGVGAVTAAESGGGSETSRRRP